MFYKTYDQEQPRKECQASQQRLLDTARGLFEGSDGPAASATSSDDLTPPGKRIRRCMRSFPLTETNLRPDIKTPEDFHAVLCELIRNAKDRVYLATLYVGVGGDGKGKEDEFLAALSDCQAPDVRILMDRSRGLRPIQVTRSSTSVTGMATTIETRDSAKAAHDALRARDHERADVFLFQVLSPWQQLCLPNPLDEIFGVFHIKCYVIDQDIILTGANLSEEYFTNRVDRYLWLTSGDSDDNESLVSCYAEMIKALCRSAERNQPSTLQRSDRISRGELLESLTSILTEEVAYDDDSWGTAFSNNKVIAYAVPTFQAPSQIFHGHANLIPNDIDIIQNLTKVATIDQQCHMRVASAYLNLTDTLQAIVSKAPCSLLTAGPVSHGFKPKTTKDGTNKGVPWIPNAYYTLLGQSNLHCWFYQRGAWTFHAKGIWFTDPGKEAFRIDTRLRAATHGSGNYGYRSAHRDMESNLVLVFSPEYSILEDRLRNEWNKYEDYSINTIPRQPSLPLWVKWALPYIRTFL
jgi:CDP-diacylglycerol---glycerol-3-phosphate 3-phosphatidyltransferase